jgi:hypothetical protein
MPAADHVLRGWSTAGRRAVLDAVQQLRTHPGPLAMYPGLAAALRDAQPATRIAVIKLKDSSITHRNTLIVHRVIIWTARVAVRRGPAEEHD